MGSRMAIKLLEAGYPLVAYNRTRERADSLQDLGAEVAATPADLAERADVVLGCLLNGAAIEQVYTGQHGLIGSSRAGQIYVEHGTFAPQLARRLAHELDERGAAFLDAPVTGGPEAAASGNLTTMIGGEAEAVASASGILQSYTARICHIGPSGTGLELKLVNQLLVSCHVAAAAEATAMLQRLRLPLETASEVLNAGWASSAMLERGLSHVRDELLDQSEATIGGLIEPQQLVAQLAAEAGLDLALMPVVTKMFRDACDDGMGTMDLAALFRVFDGAAS
jgi:3-hydroxyisobutyrate dehydrogenase-like beta-hydroxyacid dehydrogenase